MPSSIIQCGIISNAFSNSYRWEVESLAEGVHAWLVDISEHRSLLPEATVFLQEEEQERANKFRREGDRNRFILGRIVLRKLLGELLQCPPQKIPIVLSKHKKPVLAGASEGLYHFSVSHSENYILIGISRNEVGVDIEHIDPAFDYKNVMQYSFNEEEIAFVREHLHFYLLWTRKEALLKATGKGLTSKLSRITALDGRQEIAQDIIDSRNNYTIDSLSINDNYVASICREEKSGKLNLYKKGYPQ